MSIIGRAHAPAVAGTTLLPPAPPSHSMTTGAIMALARVPVAGQTAALDRYAVGLARHLGVADPTTNVTGAMLFADPRRTSFTNASASFTGEQLPASGGITAYLEPWVLAKPDVGEKIRAEIDQLQQTGEMTWIRTRRLPQADDIINVHFALADAS
jgi:hypothetical protein